MITIDADPDSETTSGNDTMDRVFLLSVDEVDRYFADKAARICKGTPYCKAQDGQLLGGSGYWWLRSSDGKASIGAPFVDREGDADRIGIMAMAADNSVRPAMWIDLTFDLPSESTSQL